MMRAIPAFFGLIMALQIAACTPAVETRIRSAGTSEIPDKTNYVFISGPGRDSPVNIAARNLVADSLYLKNWTENDGGIYAVSVSVSVLPASIDIYENNSVDKTTERIVKRRSKKNHIWGACAAALHRFDVKIFRIADGAELYSGTASEYHCKADIAETLPYLTNAAMGGLGQEPSVRLEEREGRN